MQLSQDLFIPTIQRSRCDSPPRLQKRSEYCIIERIGPLESGTGAERRRRPGEGRGHGDLYCCIASDKQDRKVSTRQDETSPHREESVRRLFLFNTVLARTRLRGPEVMNRAEEGVRNHPGWESFAGEDKTEWRECACVWQPPRE